LPTPYLAPERKLKILSGLGGGGAVRVVLSMETPTGDAAGLGECCLGVEASGSWFVLSTAASDAMICRSGVPFGGFSPAWLAAVLLSTRFFSAATDFALVMLAAVAWLGAVPFLSDCPKWLSLFAGCPGAAAL